MTRLDLELQSPYKSWIIGYCYINLTNFGLKSYLLAVIVTADAGFLPGIFSRGTKSIMKISFVVLFFLLFSDQILGGCKSLRGGQTAKRRANCLRGRPTAPSPE